MHKIPKQTWPKIDKNDNVGVFYGIGGLFWDGDAIITNGKFMVEVPCVKMEPITEGHRLLPLPQRLVYELSRRATAVGLEVTDLGYQFNIGGEVYTVEPVSLRNATTAMQHAVTRVLERLEEAERMSFGIDPAVMAPIPKTRFVGTGNGEMLVGSLEDDDHHVLGRTLFMCLQVNDEVESDALDFLRVLKLKLEEAEKEAEAILERAKAVLQKS